MHADEYRDPTLTSRQKFDMVASDPEKLRRMYELVLGGSGGAWQKEAGLSDSPVQLGGMGEQERNDLRRRISSAHNALEGLKEENVQLRRQLKALRNSRTMKTGKLIVGPARAALRAGLSVKSGRKGTSALSGTSGKKGIRTLRDTVKRVSGSFTTQPSSELTEVRESLDSPMADFSVWATQKSFERALNYQWYNLGSISGAKSFIDDNPRWVPEASDRATILIHRVKGAWLLQRNSVSIPVRSQGIAYTAEPDRIMYCVHSTPIFNSNGYSTRTRGVAKGIAAAGGDVVVVARSGYPWDSKVDRTKPQQKRFAEELDGITYVHNPGPNLNRDSLDDYINEAADAFVRESLLTRPSIIQSASNHRTALPALIAARRVGVPFVYEVRGLWEITEAVDKPEFADTERFNLMKELETLVASEADRVLVITQEVAEELVARGIDREKISIVPNAVDPNEFIPLPRDKQFAAKKGYDPELPTIGFAGSFVGYEGLDLLLKSSTQLTAAGVEHQVVLAGSGVEEASLKEQVQAAGNQNIHFLGRLPQNEIVRLLSTFDIVACPRKSTAITELVSPLKPLESFATSTATVLSDVSPNRTLAGDKTDNPRAAVFPADDVDALTAVLRTLIENADLRRDLERTARLWVVRERNWLEVGKQILMFQREARRFSHEHSIPGRSLADLKVGFIADEFTRASLEASFDAVALDRENWREQLSGRNLDFLFVESAWEGNSGQWHRGVGYYGDAENTDLFQLVEYCNEQGIPTVFWNKEDPVHFNRFIPTAARFDHVFTTDANMISAYRAHEGNRNLTVSSQAFYAQPRLHNPLLGRSSFTPSLAYAGTYYGDRYKERSARLAALLEKALPYGIDIYDRQADNPDSPYRFPPQYQPYVRGALPYNEVIDTYKNHLANINVNSVENSPTMFSRRVVEIPACGGVLVSAQGRGISESLGSTIATSNDPDTYEAWLYTWAHDPNAWFNERWRQMRTVFRSHISTTSLTVLARSIGLAVVADELPGYALEAQVLGLSHAKSIINYSLRPAVVIGRGVEKEALKLLNVADIAVVESSEELSEDIVWIGTFRPEAGRTFYEDLLTASRYGDWGFIDARVGEVDRHDIPLAAEVPEAVGKPALQKRGGSSQTKENPTPGIVLTIPQPEVAPRTEPVRAIDHSTESTACRILVAGHDLKFALSFIEKLKAAGHHVDIDKWDGHDQHDEEASLAKLRNADIVFAEWGLGNAVWYSRHLQRGQRLHVRVHLQELSLPYLARINHEAVDSFVFVGELIRRAAITSHGVPEEKTCVVSNYVDTEGLNRPKHPGVARTLGFVGMTPQRKRFDLALDLLEKLLAEAPGYRLRVKGKMPSDYPWMKNRPDEMAYYEEQMRRVSEINQEHPGAVVFDDFGPDMAEWYRNIGIAISTSDFESFHFTVADGAASGARPIAFDWAGADMIYPESWLVGTLDQMALQLLEVPWTEADQEASRAFVDASFGEGRILDELIELVTSSGHTVLR